MAMHEYETTVRGIPTTVLLSDEDAAAAGLTKKDRVKASQFQPVEAQGESKVAEGGIVPLTTDPFAEAGVDPLTVEETVALRALLASVDATDAEGGEDVNPEKDGTPEPEKDAADSTDGEKGDQPAGNRVGRRPANKSAAPAGDK